MCTFTNSYFFFYSNFSPADWVQSQQDVLASIPYERAPSESSCLQEESFNATARPKYTKQPSETTYDDSFEYKPNSGKDKN